MTWLIPDDAKTMNSIILISVSIHCLAPTTHSQEAEFLVGHERNGYRNKDKFKQTYYLGKKISIHIRLQAPGIKWQLKLEMICSKFYYLS